MNEQSDEGEVGDSFFDQVTKQLASMEHDAKCVKACAGLPEGALDGGWTAAGISAYAKSLEEVVKDMTDTFEGIREVNWRRWGELASPDEFVLWAKRRANQMLTKHADAIKASEKPHA